MIYKEFICQVCQKTFEEFAKDNECPPCPYCGSIRTAVNFNGALYSAKGQNAKQHCTHNCKNCSGCH